MQLVNSKAELYTEHFTTANNTLLQDMYNDTLQNHTHAHMLSSSVQGQLLSILSQMMRPKYILEIGTFTGYSAICLAQGLVNEGELHTIELRDEDADTAMANFRLLQLDNKIHLHRGNAKMIIPSLQYTWDIVFIDADKTGYIDYYEMVLPALHENGIIIADNVLFHGQVLEDDIKGKNAKAIHDFNRHVKNDNRTTQVMLTVRDGLTIIKKNKT